MKSTSQILREWMNAVTEEVTKSHYDIRKELDRRFERDINLAIFNDQIGAALAFIKQLGFVLTESGKGDFSNWELYEGNSAAILSQSLVNAESYVFDLYGEQDYITSLHKLLIKQGFTFDKFTHNERRHIAATQKPEFQVGDKAFVQLAMGAEPKPCIIVAISKGRNLFTVRTKDGNTGYVTKDDLTHINPMAGLRQK